MKQVEGKEEVAYHALGEERLEFNRYIVLGHSKFCTFCALTHNAQLDHI